MKNDKVVHIDSKRKGNKIKRKAMKVGEIAAMSISNSLDGSSLSNGAVVGVIAGLWKWDAKAGVKTGAAVAGACIAIDLVGNICRNIKSIYNA